MAKKNGVPDYEKCAPHQEKFEQPGTGLKTTAKPLNSHCVNDGKPSSVSAGVKTYDSENAFIIDSKTNGKR